MKKMFSLLCMMLLMAQLATAQQNLNVLSNHGDLTSYPAKKVFFDDDAFSFTFTYGDVTKTSNSFSSSFTVALKSDEYKSLEPVEVGICYTHDDGYYGKTLETFGEKIVLGTSLGNYSFSLSDLDAHTTYYYCAYVNINGKKYYGSKKNVWTYYEDKSKIINGHRFVDLHLPSGLLWAETNIGAELPADEGDRFSWGETTPNTVNYYVSDQWVTKYNDRDGKTVLENDDDAAYVNWGEQCRMPSKKEFEELFSSNYCDWEWTYQKDSSGEVICGLKLTGWKTGNSIFLPARARGQFWYSDNHYGQFWTSTLNFNSDGWTQAYCRNITVEIMSVGFDSYSRGNCLPVRAVAEP